MNRTTIITSGLLFIVSFALSVTGVAFFRRWSVRRGFLDVPNERSSHLAPTPRGGGLIIVLVSLVGYAVIAFVIGLPVSWGYFAGAAMVAVVSWLDDLYSLPFWGRLIIQTLAAVVLLLDVGFWSEIFIPFVSATITIGDLIGPVVTVLWILWTLNAYNFMDGIDGIAALQATIAGFAWMAAALIFDLPGLFLYSGVLAASSGGFLFHNWQPARIFMGDVGSAFLGFTFGAIPLLARAESKDPSPLLPILGILFLWFFVFDTGVTLSKRLLGRKRVWEAHREHIYQKLVIEGKSHASVTLLYGVAAAFLCISILAAIALSGIYVWLALFSFVFLTLCIAFFGVRKKR